MERFKKALSLVLCFVMVFGLMPMNVFAADTVIDAAIFCSDVHGNKGVVSSVFSAIKNADPTFDPTTAAFAGDTDMSTSTVTEEAQGVYSDIACYYSYGSHETDTANVTDLVYEGDNYYIYFISQSSMSSNNPTTSGFTSTVEGLDKSKPLFIVSHMPLHSRRGDNNGAAAWYNAISAAAEKMDIVFFWAHNHTGETEVDKAAYYVAKDGTETMTIEGGSTVSPNFTYMNAGFIGQSAGRGGYVTTVKIYSDEMVFQDYNSSGAVSDNNYTHNVTVTREFAASTDSGSTDETTAPTDATDPSEETTAPTDETTAPTDGTAEPTEGKEAPSNEVTLGGTVPTTKTKTVYVLSSGNPSGTVLIADANTAGDVHLVANDGGDLSNTTTTVIYGDCDGDGDSEYYIELTDAEETNSLWTVSGSYTFENQEEYLRYNNGLSVSGSSTTWSYSSNRLSYRSSRTTYYLRYNSGWTTTSSSSSASSIYFYVPTEVEYTENVDTTVKYTMRAEDLTKVVSAEGETAELDYCLQGNGADLTTLPSGGSYSFTVLNDASDIISGDIAADGTVTFSGTTGTATVKVAYTWTQDGETYTVYKNVTVEASEPYYELNLYQAKAVLNEATGLTAFDSDKTYYTKNEDGTYTQVAADATPDSSVTYYYVTFELGDEITAPIAIKGVEEGDRYGVWAVITGYDGVLDSEGNDGEELGEVGSAIEWSSSDETIATVDPVTGIITFTGKEGIVQITADYAYGTEGKVATDTITISVTPNKYTLPADGTTDFPEYPNEGAIRFDKTAEAVGNFSETGIARVELSMTGVPYTTGSEIDVVLMLDMTGSMTTESMAAAEAAALAFAKQIILNTDGTYNNNRISVQVFNVNGVTELWAMSAVTEDTFASLKTAIESASDKRVGGGTPYSTALKGCKDILDAARTDGIGNNRQQFCVFVSDGTPTSMTTISNYDAVKAGTATSYTTTSSESYWGTYPEYYSTLMKDDGVTVYGVYTCAAAGSSGSNGQGGSGGSVNDTEEGTAIMQTVASSDDKVYTIDDYTDTSALTGVFTNIAMDILQAATDVTVEDRITDEYTMIFDIPEGTKDITGVTNDFYIEFVKYALDENHERTTSTSITKLYLKNTNGVYSAASDASGTAYDAPTFEAVAIGDKGTMLYWTTDSNYASKAAVSYTVDGTTYYFIPYGMELNEDGTIPTGWYNMTSGGYANGTVDATNMSQNLVIATPYFVYNAATRMLYWTVDKLDTYEYALRYFLYLDDSATEVGTDKETDPGSYPTNDHAYITYTNFRGSDCRQVFPVPQLTWSGAQVSYVFYLVNAAGQPINKSGQVVDFANAVFVTDVYTENTVWNKGEDGKITADSQLGIDWLANELLPSDYKVYDENAEYKLHVYGNHDGTSNFDYFIIGGSSAAEISSSLNSRLEGVNTTASTVSLTTTKVYNTKAGQKITGYGTYTSEATNSLDNEIVLSGIDFYNTTVAFAVIWQPKLVPDVVVVDYGLDVLINVVQNDLMQNTVSGIGLGKDAYGNTEINTGVSSESKLGTANQIIDGNTISIENENQVRFHQGDMEFNKKVVFYYESPVEFYEDSDKQTGYMYSSVTVIPATTIYYEDDFVDLTVWKVGENGANTKTDEQWAVEGIHVDATQAQDRPGTSQISAALDADNNYGYDSAYANMSEFSMGSARKVTVNSKKFAEAKFTFYGTGFDLISLTSNTTGTITLVVYNENNEIVASGLVDTYYGYTKVGDEWVITPDTGNALYQVPVAEISGLTYGKYTAVVTAAYVSGFDHVAPGTDGSYDFYLDAVRIYDPANDGASDEDIEDAYVADGEGWPSYIELRNELIDAGTLDNASTAVNGMVFIDGAPAVGDNQISDYNNYGPNNEVYLAAGQSVAFILETPNNIDRVQIGVKSADGTACGYSIQNVTTGGTFTNKKDFTVSTATDMYYDLTAWKSGIIVITNTNAGSGILSITNIKSTYTSNPNGTNTADAQDVQGVFETYIYMTPKAAELTLNAMKPEPVNPFADVQKDHFFYESVLWAVKNGITNGVNADHFGPFMYCNRAQVVTFLWRAAGSPEPAGTVNPFTDVKESDFFYKAVLWAVENGITNGMTATTFGSNALCNRAQVVTFLWRANGSVVVGAENPFADVPADAFYHDAVVWAVKNGITTGTSATTFDPNGTCMRAHVVTFLYRAEHLPEVEVSGWNGEF